MSLAPLAVIATGALATVFVGSGGTSYAQTASAPGQSACSQYETYAALGTAAGVRTLQSWPGVVPDVTVADAHLPGAQAAVGSTSGSTGWAGAPYATAFGALGFAGVDPNQLPVFVTSSYPTRPEAATSTPAATIEAKSAQESSTARAVGGPPASEEASAGQTSASAAARCADDGTVQGTAENVIQVFDVKGVLRIGSVTSRAEAVVDPAGKVTLKGTMEVEGATILEQPVRITDQGLVLSGSTSPAPKNPLAQALTDAGITLRYIEVAKDQQNGAVFAPGLELVVSRGVQDVGAGAATTTYTLGRAYALAAATPGDPASIAEDTGTVLSAFEPPSGQLESPSEPGVPVEAATPPELPDGAGAAGAGALLTSRFDDISWAGSYGVMTVGVLLLLAGSVAFKRLGVRLRWR